MPKHYARPAADAKPLAARATNALVWSFLNTAISRFGTLGIGIVLARVLGPEEFGTYAVALVALSAVLTFNDLGVSLAVVRWTGDPREIAPTVTTVATLCGTALFALSWIGAPYYTAAMGQPEATSVVRLLAFNIVIGGIVATPATLMQRLFQQKKRLVIDQVNVWTGAILSVLLAVNGMGAMSLAVGKLAGTVLSGVLFVVLSPIPVRFGLVRSQVRPLLAFGLPIAGAGTVAFAVGYVDQLIVGRQLGAVQLGFYVLAFNLANWPVSLFSQPLRTVAPAVFSRLQHDPPAQREAFVSVIGILGAVTLPLCLILAGAAQPIVDLVYGDEWGPAGPVLFWLGILAAFRILFELCYDYLVITGMTRSLFGVQLIWIVLLVPALLVGASFGLPEVALAEAAVAGLLIFPVYLVLLRRAELRVWSVIRKAFLNLLVGGCAGAVAYLVSERLSSDLAAIGISGFVGLAAVAALLFRERHTVGRLRRQASKTDTTVEVDRVVVASGGVS